jgi:Toprim-like
MAKLTQAQINALKDISIHDYLLQRGYKPTHHSGNSYFFDLTNSGKKTGETSVMINTNRFHDFSEGKGGDIIQLVQILEKVEFLKAVQILNGSIIQEIAPKINFEKFKKSPAKKVSFSFLNDLDKTDLLFNYANKRGINDETITKSQVSFIEDKLTKHFYIGLKNNNGGYSVRNPHIKGVRGDNAITTITHDPNGNYIVLEGMFEYLSILEVTQNYNQNFLILNSTSFAETALNFIEQNPKNIFHILTNNDAAGLKTSERLATAPNTVSYVNLIPDKSDLNHELVRNRLSKITDIIFLISPNKHLQMKNTQETTEKPVEKLDQTKKKELFSNYLKENGAGGLDIENLEKNYADRKLKPNAPKFTFLDDVVGKGMSDVFEFYVLIFEKGSESLLQTGKTLDDLLKSGEAKYFKKEGRIKMDLYKDDKGELQVHSSTLTKQQELKKPENNVIKLLNYKATDEEITRLYDKKETVLLGEDGKKYYAKIDFETNNIIFKNQKAVSPNFVVKTMLGTELSEEERTKLYDGKSIDIKVENFQKKNGDVLNGKAKVQYDPITNSFNINRFYSSDMLDKFSKQNNAIVENLKKQYENKEKVVQDVKKAPAKKQTFKKP